ncbi:MAG: hypothetical protein Q9182_000209 [Xanthomendoza sp. 2 TL-2023]
MVRPNQVLSLKFAVFLLIFQFVLGLPNPCRPYTLAVCNGRPMEISEGIERRASVQQEAALRISARSSEHRLYPMSFTHAAVALPAPIVARVLAGFYDRLIAECRRRQTNNLQPGVFVDIEINRLQFIVISQGAGLTWPFVIRFAEMMKGMVERGLLSTYDGYYAAAPGDIMVYVGLRVIERGIFGTRVLLPTRQQIKSP